ncbi:MAG: transaldolase [Betaproteobacteria bacterium]|nr:transaldolase [Betaproteobacteria bacterium]
MATLKELQALGQAVWLDFISRELMASGELSRRVAAGLRGLTSNPAIFEKALAQGGDYARQARQLAAQGLNPKAIYERIAISDIQAAADALRPVHEATGGGDGYVSLEVSPDLANDTAGTLAEARRLWREVARPNLMVKVPGTPAGVPAIRDLIAEGVNVNVTLLFAQAAYRAVAAAYVEGLQARSTRGEKLDRVASVASFFVSRIDTAVDAQLEAKIATASDPARAELEALRGKAAIANARMAYQHYLQRSAGADWKKLAAAGARPQRLLWASTSCKNPAYRDVVYVEELIGADTVNTLPPATLDAFLDHGVARTSITQSVDAARRDLDALARLGIALDMVTDGLLRDGVKQFADAFDKLLGVVSQSVH